MPLTTDEIEVKPSMPEWMEPKEWAGEYPESLSDFISWVRSRLDDFEGRLHKLEEESCS